MSAVDPIFYVKIFPSKADGGGEIDVSERVLSLVYDEEESKPDKLTLSVDNFDLTNFDSPKWKSGNRVEVAWGYEGNMSPIRQLTIQKVTGSLVLAIEAHSPSVLMNKTQRIRTFKKLKRSEIAKQIAAEYGYGEDRQLIDDSVETMDHVTQARMTDAQLLRDLARREGFEFYVDFDGFHWHKRKLGQKPLRQFVYYTDQTGDILTWNIENDLYARKAGGVQLQARDPLKKTDIDVKADNASTKDATSLAPEKLIITGLDTRDGHTTGDFTKENGSTAIGRTNEKTKEAAQRAANGMWSKNQMNAALLNMECRGDPSIIAKIVVTVLGIGKTISGNYYVKGAQHKVGAGYLMSLKCRRDGRTSANNASAYAGSSAGGVPSKGPQNTASAPDKKPGANDPRDDLTAINQKDGSVSYTENRGRTQDDAPGNRQANDQSDPLGLVHPLPEDHTANDKSDPLGLVHPIGGNS